MTKDQGPKKSSTGSGSRSSNSKGTERRSLRNHCAGPSKHVGNNINLARLTSQEFDALLEDGADKEVTDKSADLAKEKKKSDEAKLENIIKRNDQVLKLPNINDQIIVDVEQNETETQQPEQENTSNQNAGGDSSQENNCVSISQEQVFDRFRNIGIVTEPTTVFCGCPRCTDMLRRFYTLVRDARSLKCTGSPTVGLEAFHENESWPQNLSSTSHAQNSSISLNRGGAETDEGLVPLIQGCQVMIPLTKKSNIKHRVLTGDPQDYVNELMDIFFKPEEMAVMTAEGRTKGSTKMNQDIKDAILAYVSVKYDKKKFNFNKVLLTEFVNSKCYCERRKLWHKANAAGDVETIRKLEKKVKKSPANKDTAVNDENKQKTKKSTTKVRKFKSSSPRKKPADSLLKSPKHSSTPKKNKASRDSSPGCRSVSANQDKQKSGYSRHLSPPLPSGKRSHDSHRTSPSPSKHHRRTTGGKRPKSIYQGFSVSPSKYQRPVEVNNNTLSDTASGSGSQLTSKDYKEGQKTKRIDRGSEREVEFHRTRGNESKSSRNDRPYHHHDAYEKPAKKSKYSHDEDYRERSPSPFSERDKPNNSSSDLDNSSDC